MAIYLAAVPAIPPALVQIAAASLIMLTAVGLSEWLKRRSAQRLAQRLAQRPAVTASAQPRQPQPRQPQPRIQQPLQWVNQAKQQERLGHPEIAVRLYEQALQQYPQDSRLWHERGLLLAKLQRFDAAIDSYDRAYQIRPQQRDLAHERGDALLHLGRYSEAIDSFDIFLQYAPQNGHVLADRGYALMQLGCYREALKSLDRALAQRWEPGVQIQARRYQIEALRRSGQLEAALKAAQTALQQYPNAQFEAEYARLQQQLGQA